MIAVHPQTVCTGGSTEGDWGQGFSCPWEELVSEPQKTLPPRPLPACPGSHDERGLAVQAGAKGFPPLRTRSSDLSARNNLEFQKRWLGSAFLFQ